MYPLNRGSTAATSIVAASVQKYATRRYDWPRLGAAASPTLWEDQNPAFTWKGTKSMEVSKFDADPDSKQAGFSAVFGANPANLSQWVFSFQDALADVAAEGVWFCEIDLWQSVYAFDRVVVADALRTSKLGVVRMCQEESKDSPVLVPRPLVR
jgi:hypothetical protein